MANQIVVNTKSVKSTISRHIYGQFAEHLGRCIYNGIYVGENSPIPNTNGMRSDVVQALKNIRIPVLRWPGGCFADEYHWQDGIGPKENRPSMVNTHWGGVTEDNSFGTHEFFELCRQLECEPYICGNVGSGTVQEMSQWVEYMTFDGLSPMANLRRQNGQEEPWKLKYFGIGNENWGCGGGMRAEYYADELCRYATYARSYGDNKLYKIAAGPRFDNYHWTEVLMKNCTNFISAIAMHYYTRIKDSSRVMTQEDGNQRYGSYPGFVRGSATDFTEQEWFDIMKAAFLTEELLSKHIAIMDKYDPEKKVDLLVDEWGTWWDCEPGTNPGFLYQQNTLRDAITAAISLDCFNAHSDRIKMANIAQMINVLQAMILTEGDQMVLTPTYHIFDLYKVHMDAQLLDSAMVCDRYEMGNQSLNQITRTISRDAEGRIHITVTNVDHLNAADVTIHLGDFGPFTVTDAKVLTADSMNAMNTFEEPEALKPFCFKGYEAKEGEVKIQMPSKSVVALELCPIG